MTYTRILFVSPIRYRLNSLDFELITALKDLKKMYPQTTKSVNYSTSLLVGVTKSRRTWQCSVQILELAVYSCNVRKNRSQIRVRSPTPAPTRRNDALSTHAGPIHSAVCLGSFSRSNPSFIQGPIYFDRATFSRRFVDVDRHVCARALVEEWASRREY